MVGGSEGVRLGGQKREREGRMEGRRVFCRPNMGNLDIHNFHYLTI